MAFACLLAGNSLLRMSRAVCTKKSSRALSSMGNELKRTALYDFHVARGGKMVPFGGWSMPVQYDDLGIIQSSLHTRKQASLFDVSHMLQTEISGTDAAPFLEHISVVDTASLKEGSASLSVITNSEGGIIDDCIITRTGEQSFFVVSNAGRIKEDLEHMKTMKYEFSDVSIAPMWDKSLLSLQGPSSAVILQEVLNGDLTKLKFMQSSVMTLFGIPGCRISRCGYTGEDGFEISISSDQVVEVVEKLLQVQGEAVKLAGLGARDILRIEAGLCLYGNDINETTTPIEAGLSWCISKRRRKEGGFIGALPILGQLKDGPFKRRVGIITTTGPPVRAGGSVHFNSSGNVGTVTSGCPSPNLKCNISMAYVPKSLSKKGTQLNIEVRNHFIPGTVTKMPFVSPKYYH